MVRLTLLTTALMITAAPVLAQGTTNSPFGAPSAPLTAEEKAAIKREADAHRRARAEAARKAEEARAAKESSNEIEVKEETPPPTSPDAAPVTDVEVSDPEPFAPVPVETQVEPEPAPEDAPKAAPSDSGAGDVPLPAAGDMEMPSLPPIEDMPAVKKP